MIRIRFKKKRDPSTSVYLCVFHTLTVGFMLDYYITLVEDCAATTYGPQPHQEAIGLIKKHHGVVASSSEIVQVWSEKLRKTA